MSNRSKGAVSTTPDLVNTPNPNEKQIEKGCFNFFQTNKIDRSERFFFINDYERNLLERKFQSNYIRTT